MRTLEINDIMIAADTGTMRQIIGRDDNGIILRNIPNDTPYDPEVVHYCFESMLRPFVKPEVQ